MLSVKRSACFAGHRSIECSDLLALKFCLNKTIKRLIQEGIFSFLCGGAIGFDMLAGHTVLDIKAKNYSVKLIMVLPCCEQDSVWSENYKAAYRELLTNADEIIYVSEKYYYGCTRERNLHLIEGSEVCIAYRKNKKARGGAGQAISLAKEKGIPIINLADMLINTHIIQNSDLNLLTPV